MTCPAPVCTVTPRPPAPVAPAPLAPALGLNPLTETVTKYTSCDGCGITSVNPIIETRQPVRVITMGQDPCVPSTPATPATLYSSTKTVTLSQAFTKNNCTTGTGSTVTYTTGAEATAYSATSQAQADILANQTAQTAAQQDIMTNGQGYANLNGACA